MRLLKLMEFLFPLSMATSVKLVLHFSLSLTGVWRAWTLMCIYWLRTAASVALNGICTQQHSSDGVFKNQCYSTSAFGIVGFHSAVVVKPGILADTGFVLFKDLTQSFCAGQDFSVWELTTGSPWCVQFVSLNRCLEVQSSQLAVWNGLAVEEETACWTGEHWVVSSGGFRHVDGSSVADVWL